METNTEIPDAIDRKGRGVYLDTNGHRDFSPAQLRRVQAIAAVLLLAAALVGVWAYLAVSGVVPAAPWSAVGKA